MPGWFIKDLDKIPKNNLKVFSCFHCGGGSSFGYKLAGYDVLGGVEIDKQIMEVYRANHHPKYSYLMSVSEFNKIPDAEIPKELFELDILDGSPPCSSFSIAGDREKKWGKNTFFREGQAEQVLDDLFFEFIKTAEKLKPKIIIAENVKGLVTGKSKGYVKMIAKRLKEIGYDTQLFLLNAAQMNVPQSRERVFFVSRKTNLNLPHLILNPNEKLISVKQAWSDLKNQTGRLMKPNTKLFFGWQKAKPGQNVSKALNINMMFNNYKNHYEKPSLTLPASEVIYHPLEPRYMSDTEIYRLQTFPDDYNPLKLKAMYMCGMSVPPKMTEYIAKQIHLQWFKHI